ATRCRTQRWCAGNWPEYPGWRWRVCPRRRSRSCSGTRSPRSERIWRASHGSSFHFLVRQIRKKCLRRLDIAPRRRHDPSMDRHALERLGHHIVSRRVALGYRNRTDLANSLQFTVRTLSDIENGVRKASPGTYAMLENKLAWAPGSIDTILAGGEPKELVVKLRRESSEPRYHSFSADALSRASTEELLLELRRRIVRPRDRRRQTWDDWDGPDSRDDWGKLDSRGDWPEEGYLHE